MSLRHLRTLGALTITTGWLVLVHASGCSSNEAPNLVPISLFPQAYAQALCASLRHCCSENQVAFSDPDCTAGWKETVGKLAADPVLASNYDSRLATDCIRRVTGAANVTCDPEPGSISDARDVCQRVFVGKKPIGALCSSSAECAPADGLIVGCEGLPIPDPSAGLLPLGGAPAGSIRPAALPTVRKCVAIQPPEAGSSCAAPELRALCERDPTLYCDQGEGVCRARADVGGACGAGGCKVGLYCDNGACVPGGIAGASCATSEQCNSFLRCDTGSRRCEDRLRPHEGCGSDEECSIGVCDLVTRRCLRNAIATSESCSGRDPASARTR
mgnify:CR=1 FL=1